jgi:hypothetical protein
MSIYRVMTDDGGGSPHHNIYKGHNVVDAITAFARCMPEGGCVLDYDRHIITDEPAIVMRRPSDGKTLAAMWGVTWEQWEEIVEME